MDQRNHTGLAVPLPSVAKNQANSHNESYLYATDFPGGTAGQKIRACIAALPRDIGGTCDARRKFVIPGKSDADVYVLDVDVFEGALIPG